MNLSVFDWVGAWPDMVAVVVRADWNVLGSVRGNAQWLTRCGVFDGGGLENFASSVECGKVE